MLHPVSSLLLPFPVYTFIQQQPCDWSFFAYQQPKVRLYFRWIVYFRLFIGIYLLSEVTAMHLFNSLGWLCWWNLVHCRIGNFTVVCLVTWPLSGSEAGGDLVLIQTLLLFICKYKLVSMRTTWFTYEKQEGLYQNKVTFSLASTQRPGH